MIRRMVEDDIEILTAIGGRMHSESAYSHTQYSADKCRALGENIIASPNLVGLVSEINGDINGFFIGVVSEHYFSDTLMSSDLLLYVVPKHRNGLSGIRLIKSYIEWAKESGIEPCNIQLGQTAGIDPAAVDRLYKKLGFHHCGTLYKMRG